MRMILAIGLIIALVGGAVYLYIGRDERRKTGAPTADSNPLIRVPVITAKPPQRSEVTGAIPLTMYPSEITYRDVRLSVIKAQYTSAEIDANGRVTVRRVYSPQAARHAGETKIGRPVLVNRGAWGGPNAYWWEVSSSGNIASEFGGVLKAGIPAIATAVATIYGGPAAGAAAGAGSSVLVSTL